jgi:hypothetical protein
MKKIINKTQNVLLITNNEINNNKQSLNKENDNKNENEDNENNKKRKIETFEEDLKTKMQKND